MYETVALGDCGYITPIPFRNPVFAPATCPRCGSEGKEKHFAVHGGRRVNKGKWYWPKYEWELKDNGHQ